MCSARQALPRHARQLHTRVRECTAQAAASHASYRWKAHPGWPVNARWPQSGSFSQARSTTGERASTVYGPAQSVMLVSSTNCMGARWLSSLNLQAG